MEKLYKLKKDARHFFQGSTIYDDVSKDIQQQKWWDDRGIHPLLLEEVPLVYVSYGHESVSQSGTISRDLKGWSSPDKSSHYNFSIKVSDPDGKIYRDVKIEEVMDHIQLVLDNYFKSKY